MAVDRLLAAGLVLIVWREAVGKTGAIVQIADVEEQEVAASEWALVRILDAKEAQ